MRLAKSAGTMTIAGLADKDDCSDIAASGRADVMPAVAPASGIFASGVVVAGICALVGALPAARFCPGSCCCGTANHFGGFTPKTPGTISPSASIANADHNIWRFSIWRGSNIDSNQPLTTIDVLAQNLSYISAARTSRTSGM